MKHYFRNLLSNRFANVPFYKNTKDGRYYLETDENESKWSINSIKGDEKIPLTRIDQMTNKDKFMFVGGDLFGILICILLLGVAVNNAFAPIPFAIFMVIILIGTAVAYFQDTPALLVLAGFAAFIASLGIAFFKFGMEGLYDATTMVVCLYIIFAICIANLIGKKKYLIDYNKNKEKLLYFRLLDKSTFYFIAYRDDEMNEYEAEIAERKRLEAEEKYKARREAFEAKSKKKKKKSKRRLRKEAAYEDD